jgi:hypothetical protein
MKQASKGHCEPNSGTPSMQAPSPLTGERCREPVERGWGEGGFREACQSLFKNRLQDSGFMIGERGKS